MKTVQKLIGHIRSVQTGILHILDELQTRAFIHDLSKFSSDEFPGYQRITEGMPEGLEFGSPEHKAALAEVMEGNNCFEIHCQRNSHHPEFHGKAEDMPLFDLIEMVCDWAGAHVFFGEKMSWEASLQHNIDRFHFTDAQIWVIWQVSDFLEKQMNL